MKNVKLILLLVLFSSLIKAQDLAWVNGGRSSGFENFILSKIDPDGNVFTAGNYSETFDYENQTIENFGFRDVFIKKRDTDGNLLWLTNISSGQDVGVLSMSVAADGGVVIGGTFQNTLNANPTNGIYNLVSNGGYDIYIIKLNANGAFVWANSYGSIANDYVFDIETDSTGNVLASIFYNDSSIQLSPTITLEAPDTALPLSNGLFKIDQNGNMLWGAATGTAFVKDITLDNNNNIYVAGFFLLENDFDYGAGTFLTEETGAADFNLPINQDGYIQKLNPDGDFIWAKQLKNPVNTVVHSIAINNNNNVYTCGVWQGSENGIDFDPGPGVYSVPSESTLNSKHFIHKLNESGDFEWVHTFGSWYLTSDYLDPEQGGFLEFNDNNDLYYAGDIGSIDGASFLFGGETYTPNALDILLAKINIEDGSVDWSYMLDGAGNDNTYATDVIDNSWVVSGNFQNNVNLSIDGNTDFTLQSNGSSDFFVMKIDLSSTLSNEDTPVLQPQFAFYPNPVEDYLTIQMHNNSSFKELEFEIWNLAGIHLGVKSENIENNRCRFNVSNLSEGLYLVVIKDDAQNLIDTFKLIKK